MRLHSIIENSVDEYRNAIQEFIARGRKNSLSLSICVWYAKQAKKLSAHEAAGLEAADCDCAQCSMQSCSCKYHTRYYRRNFMLLYVSVPFGVFLASPSSGNVHKIWNAHFSWIQWIVKIIFILLSFWTLPFCKRSFSMQTHRKSPAHYCYYCNAKSFASHCLIDDYRFPSIRDLFWYRVGLVGIIIHTPQTRIIVFR